MKQVLLIFTLIAISCNSKPATAEIEVTEADTTAIVQPVIESKKDEKKAKELSNFFTVKKDEFESIEWIKPKSAPNYTNYDALYCYFAINEGIPNNFRFVLQYVDDDWLFIENAKFSIDGQVFNYYPNEVKRDNDGGEIWEWWDQQITNSDLPLLQAISNCKSAKIKLNGSQYYKVVNITDKQKLNIKRSLDYYESLGGKFDL